MKMHLATRLFQFHEGPIKTGSITLNADNTALFQFHEGPIKTFCVQAVITRNNVSIP